MTRVEPLPVARPGAKFLAVLSVAGFWLLPWSPLVAIGAVRRTEGTAGWPRRVAVAGAGLCTAWTLVLGGAMITVVVGLLR